VADLAGDDRAIAGYLVEEVLAAQPPELRAFLLRTCVADRLCGDLADALTGGTDGARVLARLEREHVFTSAAGPTRAWYRYHPLFAELLRAELHYGHAAELPGLHRRAASWHADAGQPVPAVRPWPPATSTRRPACSPRTGRSCWPRARRPCSGSWSRGCPASGCGPARSWPSWPP
jgi:ATP/maltotriose-dependent transcriptional regulator MalT